MFKVNTKHILKTQTIYISGPMTGLPDYNRAAFNLREEAFRTAGYDNVLNPAKISEQNGDGRPYEWYLKKALSMMLTADVLYIFGDVTTSRGVDLELYVASRLRMPIVFEGGGYVR